MQENITYLLGAGASIENIPIMSGFVKGFDEVIKHANIIDHSLRKNTDFKGFENEPLIECYKQFIKDLEWLRDLTKVYNTPDTYARMLRSVQQKDDLTKLKIILSCYFELIQTLNNNQNRYIPFLSHILNSEKQLKSNVRIISWNYDLQIEKAYSIIENQKDLNYIKSCLKIIHKKDKSLESNRKKESHSTKINNIFKLNGSTNLSIGMKKDIIYLNTLENQSFETTLIHILKYYNAFLSYFKSSNINSALSFSWDNDSDTAQIFIDNLKHNIRDTNVLVIIGYSFPFENYKIDKIILESMSDLKKIYIQSTEDESYFQQKFEDFEIKLPEPKLRTDLRSFYIPPALI